jgi:hypothetical protein
MTTKISPSFKGRYQEMKRGKKLTRQKIINKMVIVSPYLLITTLAINGLNYQPKKYTGLNRFKKQDPTLFLSIRNSF